MKELEVKCPYCGTILMDLTHCKQCGHYWGTEMFFHEKCGRPLINIRICGIYLTTERYQRFCPECMTVSSIGVCTEHYSSYNCRGCSRLLFYSLQKNWVPIKQNCETKRSRSVIKFNKLNVYCGETLLDRSQFKKLALLKLRNPETIVNLRYEHRLLTGER